MWFVFYSSQVFHAIANAKFSWWFTATLTFKFDYILDSSFSIITSGKFFKLGFVEQCTSLSINEFFTTSCFAKLSFIGNINTDKMTSQIWFFHCIHPSLLCRLTWDMDVNHYFTLPRTSRSSNHFIYAHTLINLSTSKMLHRSFLFFYCSLKMTQFNRFTNVSGVFSCEL